MERLEQIAAVLQVSVPQLLTIAETCWLAGRQPPSHPGGTEMDAAGYHAALRALEQLVQSLLADINHLRRQNEQLTRLLCPKRRPGAKTGSRSCLPPAREPSPG